MPHYRNKSMDININMIKQDPDQTVIIKTEIKTESEDGDICRGNIKIESLVDAEDQFNKIVWDTIKEEPGDVDDESIYHSYEKLIEKEEVLLETKAGVISNREESLPDIKTEELILKSESDDSEMGAHWKSHTEDQVMNKIDKNASKDFSDYGKCHVIPRHDNDRIKKYACDYCDYKTHENGNLKSHVLIKHVEDPKKKHRCDLCNYRSNRKCHLTQHILIRHHKNSIKRYGCNHCDYSTEIKSNMKSHVLIKHVKDPIKEHGCDLCNYKSNRKSHLTQHILIRHQKNYIKRYGCDHCDYRAENKSTMNRHLMAKHVKNSIKKYTCHFCQAGKLVKVTFSG